MRSFDQRSHSYLGYVVALDGKVGSEQRSFSVALGEGEYGKHELRVGDEVAGVAEPVVDPRMETAELYKVAELEVVARAQSELAPPPPWLDIAPPLSVYRDRGQRRLDPRTYASSCASCMWGCRMPAELIIDQWKPSQRRYRVETFCYGPLSCRLYRPGPTRKVPGRRGLTWEEEDWVDQDAVSHREPDE